MAAPGGDASRIQESQRAGRSPKTGLPGNDHNQPVYVLRCISYGHEYGANSSDILQRRCPRMTVARQVYCANQTTRARSKPENTTLRLDVIFLLIDAF